MPKQAAGLNIFIFHRDLRLIDNTALLQAPKPITPVFMFIDEQIDPAKNTYFSNNAVQFMCESLTDLDNSLRKVGSHLNLFRTSSIVSQLDTIHKHNPIESITQNADFSVYAKKRDGEIQKWCDAQEPKIQFNNMPNDYDIISEDAGLLPNNKPYYVLAAYYRRVMKDLKEKRIAITVNNHKFAKRDFKTQFLQNQISFETIKTYYTHNPNGAEPSIRGRNIYIPINTWFCLDSRCAFPLISLQYNELYINVTLRPIQELFQVRDVFDVQNNLYGMATEDNYNNKLISHDLAAYYNFNTAYQNFSTTNSIIKKTVLRNLPLVNKK
jgi:hypothetical protein